MVKVGGEIMRGERRHFVWNKLPNPIFKENSPEVEPQKTTVALPPEDFCCPLRAWPCAAFTAHVAACRPNEQRVSETAAALFSPLSSPSHINY